MLYTQRRTDGQSTVEYILLVTAVIGMVIAFSVGKTSPFQARLNSTMDVMSQAMSNAANKMANGV